MNIFVICCTAFEKARAYKQFILKITSAELCFYLEYFLQVNKPDVIIFVSFLDFGCSSVSSVCRYFRNKDRPP